MGRGGAAETSGVGSTVPAKGFQLVGASNFKRSNPMTDHFEVDRFHHVEFWCADATSTWKRRAAGSATRICPWTCSQHRASLLTKERCVITAVCLQWQCASYGGHLKFSPMLDMHCTKLLTRGCAAVIDLAHAQVVRPSAVFAGSPGVSA